MVVPIGITAQGKAVALARMAEVLDHGKIGARHRVNRNVMLVFRPGVAVPPPRRG